MEKIFITVVILYALFVAICLFRLRLAKRRKKDIVGKGNSINETGHLKTDIVGKSKFKRGATVPLISKSEPVAATSPKIEKGIEEPDTFVPSNGIKPTAEVPPEELDEAFSDTPPDEDNEPMDIDYPLEYDTGNDESGEDATEEEETEEVEGTAGAALASGVRFEDLGNVVWTVNRANEATPQQKKAAGDTLLEIRQTDMFEQLILAKPDAKRIVTDLMTESFAAFYERKDRETGNSGSNRKAPDNFNIRNFA